MTKPLSPTIWILADDRPGNVNQCLGVAEALNLPYEQKNIRYNNFTKLPNLLQGSSLWSVNRQQSDVLEAPFPDIVIAAGRRTAPIARYIKRHSGKTKLVQLMWPGSPSQDFDLIAVPEHDNMPHRQNVLPIVGSPNRITLPRLEEEKEKWLPKFLGFPSPRIALLVGGNTKKHRFTPAYAHELGILANALAKEQNGSLLITTSRRTEDAAAKALMDTLTCPHHLHDWRSTEENPYFGYLSCADMIIATGDSMSMCSEAVATGKPVFIYSPPAITAKKHGRLHQHLIDLGYAKRLTDQWSEWSYTPQNPAFDIAKAVKRLIA